MLSCNCRAVTALSARPGNANTFVSRAGFYKPLKRSAFEATEYLHA